ncbi:O-antigen ligase family protein [Novosphingobium soli]|uniref:O-antigen ligase family protein n=1 Tax=Novosphingobium soli TaxID=574956 RepID=A0ABV6CSG6_9SPHN
MKPRPAARPLPQSQLTAALSNRSVQDGAFAASIVACRLPANLGMPGALGCLLLTGLYVLVRRGQARDALARGWSQLAYPAFALLSVAWTIYPAVTLRAAVQMILTAFAGLVLSQAARPRAVLTGLFVAYATYTLASLLADNVHPDGHSGALALYGMGGEAKNFFADTAGTAFLLAVATMAMGLERRAILAALSSAGVAVACAIATVRAHSAGAVAALGLAGGLLVALLVLRHRSPTLKLVAVLAVLGLLVLGAVSFQTLLTSIQELSGKDAGLTGRGYLWYRADFIIAERPWLGTGYFGFWTPGNPDAIGFWRHFNVRQEATGYSFHNSYIQTLVETGWIGLSIMVACWIGGTLALMRRFVLTPSLATCFWLSYLALQFSKSPVEPIRPAGLIAPTIMLFAALGFGCFPVARRIRSPVSGRGVPEPRFVLPVDGQQGYAFALPEHHR